MENGVVEALLVPTRERARPLELVFAAKDPTGVVFGFKYEDALLVQHEDIDLGRVGGACRLGHEHVSEDARRVAELSVLKRILGKVFAHGASALRPVDEECFATLQRVKNVRSHRPNALEPLWPHFRKSLSWS